MVAAPGAGLESGPEAAWPDGVGRLVLDETDSTNAEAHRRAAGTPGPLWIAARRQTAGRGRSGREWASPEGNLAATLLLRRDDPPAARARLSFHAALAVADLVTALAPAAEVALKWPNDVLLGGAKVSGILLESLGGRGANLAIGIGVNLAHFPPPEATRWPATSIAAATGTAPAPEAALAILAARMADWLARDAQAGFAPIRDAWLARAAHLGRRIEARLPSGTLAGIFEDVTADGALVLATGAGRRVIAAADIHFPD
ncbi:MAG: biotin--[acetyl-CoA-carboxylase] ligase [Thermohalobaculum sp.]|nr:biotin--[acetyl-CoA-carboxylase] ligase [Thermohalobaculum sp.]